MIALPAMSLAPLVQTGLDALQTRVDSCADYESRVKMADAIWDKKPRRVFDPVRRTLRCMVGKSYRCVYCEDNQANQVEHMRPKTLYPEHAFDWHNYLFACDLCNPEKRDKYAVFTGAGADYISVQRPRNAPTLPPIPGESLLLDPRREDPFDFLFLDIRGGTFNFVADMRRTSREQARAEYTIEVLGLNTRQGLARFRRSEYGTYRARMGEYIRRRDAQDAPRELKLLIGALKRLPHRTVWQEVKRQQTKIPELAALFAAAPEALTW